MHNHPEDRKLISLRNEELIRRAQGGDRKAFEALFLQCLTHIFAIARKFRLDADVDVDDLFQETSLKIWRALPRYRNQGLVAWTRRIAVNTAIDFVRKGRRKALVFRADAADDLLDQIADVGRLGADEIAARHEAMEWILLFFEKQATAEDRLVLDSILGEITTSELAKRLGISVQAAYMRRFTLLHKLTAQFFCYLGGEKGK